MKETDTDITGITSMRIYNKKRELGMLYFGTEDYSKIRGYFEGKDLVYRLKKDTGELCIREQKYPED
jgi:hypothetical protein